MAALAIVCAGASGCAFTSRNNELIRQYKSPATEHTIGIGAPLCGRLSRSGDQYVLGITNWLTSGKALELTFPAKPPRDSVAEATARVVEQAMISSNGHVVDVQQWPGRFDHTSYRDDLMRVSNGEPTRVIIGAYWDLRATGNNHVEYTVGYKYSETNWYVVARAPYEIRWMYRSHAKVAGYYSRYLYTVPLDIVTSPFQLIGNALSPKWE